MNFMYIMYRLQLENRNLFRLSLTMQKSLMLIATFRRKYLHMPLVCIYLNWKIIAETAGKELYGKWYDMNPYIENNMIP